ALVNLLIDACMTLGVTPLCPKTCPVRRRATLARVRSLLRRGAFCSPKVRMHGCGRERGAHPVLPNRKRRRRPDLPSQAAAVEPCSRGGILHAGRTLSNVGLVTVQRQVARVRYRRPARDRNLGRSAELPLCSTQPEPELGVVG